MRIPGGKQNKTKNTEGRENYKCKSPWSEVTLGAPKPSRGPAIEESKNSRK